MDKRILYREEKQIAQTESLVVQIRERARNLYQTNQLMCAETVLTALNHGLDGGLTDAQVVAMTAPFCEAMGKSGCLCGALSGAVMGAGIFLGKDHPYRHRKEIRESARQLHDAFKASNGSTCCRVLSQKVKHDKKAHFQKCADLTVDATELAARLILEKRPELIQQANGRYLSRRQSKIGGAISRLFHLFSH
ncbi:MAG: C-GCAxxG-C-C family protein [Desulfobacterales bacterium]